MTTPVLSKKQQKKSISGKKTPAKGLRNVLAQPYGFSWPILKGDKGDGLKLLLETSMSSIRRSPPHISWTNLHRMDKMGRQAARMEARLKQGITSPDKNIINSVVVGVNGVTRLLEKDNASCILLEANVEPMLLIKHIVSMADLKNVSVILVPFLKSVMLQAVGFTCAALALKKTVAESENHHFHNLYEKVVELATSFERSKPLKLDFNEDTGGSSSSERPVTNSEKSCHEREVQETIKAFILSTDIYKYRNSQKERVFIPENVLGSEIMTEKLDSDFISICKNSDLPIVGTRHMKNKRKTRYVDIHAEANRSISGMKDDSMQTDEYVFLDANSSDQVGETDSEIFYKIKSTIQGISDKSSLTNLEDDKPKKVSENHYKNFKYESLKVKRLQGNSKRIKATKDPQKNKK